MNLSQLKSDTHFLCGSTSANYPDADLVRNINIALQDVARLIWTSAGGWQFDDANASSKPIVTYTLTASTQDYVIATTIQRIEQITVKDNGGNWLKLKPFDIHSTDLAPNAFLTGTGLPQYYDLIGNTIMLYPAPDSSSCTLASGMNVYVSRDITEFSVTATTTTPGFATQFHRILSYSAAIDFVQSDNERKLLVELKDRLERGLVNFYSKRSLENETSVKPHARKAWRQYL